MGFGVEKNPFAVWFIIRPVRWCVNYFSNPPAGWACQKRCFQKRRCLHRRGPGGPAPGCPFGAEALPGESGGIRYHLPGVPQLLGRHAHISVYLFDFTGRTICPFCTREGSGMGRSGAGTAKFPSGWKIHD